MEAMAVSEAWTKGALVAWMTEDSVAWAMVALVVWMMIKFLQTFYMVTPMKNILKTLFLLFSLPGMVLMAPAHAEGLMGNEACATPHEHTDPVVNVEKRLAALKTELKITNDQEEAWNIYAEKTVRSVREIRDQMMGALHDKPQTAPERFDRHIALMKDRLASFEKMDDALKELYRRLTPEQKIQADRHFAKIHH